MDSKNKEIITITIIHKKEKGGQLVELDIKGKLNSFVKQTIISELLKGAKVYDIRIE